MPFVNEYISDADMVKYEIDKIDETLRVGRACSRRWVADKGRGVYLRLLSVRRNHPEMEDSKNISTWSINFDDDIVFFNLEELGSGKEGDGRVWNSWRLLGLEGGGNLNADKEIFVGLVREALTGYQFTGRQFSDKFYLKFEVEEAAL